MILPLNNSNTCGWFVLFVHLRCRIREERQNVEVSDFGFIFDDVGSECWYVDYIIVL